MSATRLAPPRVPSGKIALQAPPELVAGDGGSGLLSSMLPMLGSIGAIVMAVSSAGISGLITGGMFLLSSVGFVAVNGWRQRSQRQAATLGARREYLAYLSELRQTVRVAGKQQRRAANWLNPAPSALTFLAEERTRVWERSSDDADFLVVRVGTSDQPLCIQLEAPDLPPLAQLDPVAASAAHRFMLSHEIQKHLPLTAPLRDYARVEVTGNEDEARSFVRAILLHAATMHHPESLQIAVLADESVLPQWEWAKWLPHTHSRSVNDGLGAARLIGSNAAEIEDMLPADLRERPRFGRGGAARIPHIIVITDGARIPVTSAIMTADGVQGVTVIDLPARWNDLDNPSNLRIALAQDSRPGEELAAELITLQSAALPFVADQVSVVESEATARRLMPLFSGTASVSAARSGSTEQMELVDLLGLPDVRDIDFAQAWDGRLERDRLRVPIGQTTDGAPIILDIKESAQQGMGPHGVMIGATGSGKSEVLRTLVLALAMTHSPEQLNFVLVDFKGGATFAGMAGMPHVSAIITNLGDEIALVDRFQDALQGEVVRRQELLRASGNFANVFDYEKARRGGRTDLAPLPALLIVADEFSELLSAKPEFVDSFINIGRVGRSLQVHLLLASQRLEEGKLRGLDTYLSYRVGLRTFSAAESRSILGVPDAYTLPQEPGVGFLKSDTETMEQFRAAYVSGPPKRRKRAAAAKSVGHDASADVELFTAAPVWKAAPIEVAPEVESFAEPEEKRSTFEIAVDRMSGFGPKAHQVWLPPLTVPASLDEERGLGGVARVTRDPGELDEGRLDLGMAAESGDAVGPEDVADEIRRASCDREQPVVGTRPRPLAGDGRLEEMAEAVKLVPPLQVGPPRLLAGSSELGVEVAVGLLRRRHPRHDVAEGALERGIVAAADLPRGRLEELVHLGVAELAPPATRRQGSCGGAIEVRQPSLRLETTEDVVERVGGVDALSLAPEPAGDADVTEAEGAQTRAGREDGSGDGARRVRVERTGGEGGRHGHPLKAPDMKPRT